ncbi:ATP-binding protein [Pedobacter sp. G11]|uniref:ATP-binding protein n=1 Tax=Pedobacter sp. G11 TaxID=2482728 RepID=UPI000F5F9D03|nr:ATP-binding protein [Pedobacter sp. G11]AZI27430.1 ATP-binding protein [Pedobacter sp. G11]
MKNFFLFICLILSNRIDAQTITLKKEWASTEQLPVPESVVYMANRKELYVSLIDGEGNAKDGKGGVAILNLDGTIKNATWISGLNAPKGMAVYNGKLYVADLDVVHAIDLKTAKIAETVKVPDAVFLNDIAIEKKGIVYVSDTRTNKIHQISQGESRVYIDQVTAANGLKFINNELHVLSGFQLLKFDKNKSKTIITEGLEKSGDGLEPLGNGDFLVTCWAGIVYHIQKDGTKHKLLDVQGKMNTADICYDQRSKMLYVPTFNANSVIAYKVEF